MEAPSEARPDCPVKPENIKTVLNTGQQLSTNWLAPDVGDKRRSDYLFYSEEEEESGAGSLRMGIVLIGPNCCWYPHLSLLSLSVPGHG